MLTIPLRAAQLERIGTLEDRIQTEIEELENRSICMREDMEKYNDMSELRDSVESAREHLAEMKEKFARGIQSLDDLLEEEPTPRCREEANELCNSSEWKELGEWKVSQGQGHTKSDNATIDYGNVKAECLRLMESINQSMLSQLQ